MTTETEAITIVFPVDACRHHWLIEIANGPTSRGRCKRCGAERDFFNNAEDALRQREEPVAAS
ncbi:MAG: hypothetical protein GEU75_01315 [Dehalococcoidia bacterium]|nr:hypothetical protein [Dehalococcoidia bacterium]